MPVTNLSAEELQQILTAVLKEARSLNPLEQKKYDEELAREKRKNAMMLQLGKIEEESMRNKKNACSHMRYAAGKNAGMSARKGDMGAEWCTGGQALQDGSAMVICLRCSSTWRWRPHPEEYSMILQNGLLGVAPPPEELVLCDGCSYLKSACHCAEMFPDSNVLVYSE